MMTAGERRKKQMNEEENAIRQQGMPGMGDSYNIVMQKAASAATNRSSDSAGDEQMMHRDKLMSTLGNIRQQENDFTQYVDNALKSLGEQQNAQIGQAMEQERLVVDIKPTTAMQYVDQNRAKSRTSDNRKGMQQTAMQKQQIAQAQVTLDRNVKGMQKQQVAQAQSGLDRNVQVMQQQEEQAHNRAQHLEAQRQAQQAAAGSGKPPGKMIDGLVKIEMETAGTDLNNLYSAYVNGHLSKEDFEAAKNKFAQDLKYGKIDYRDRVAAAEDLSEKKAAWADADFSVPQEYRDKLKREYEQALERVQIHSKQLNYLKEHEDEFKEQYGSNAYNLYVSYYSVKNTCAVLGSDICPSLRKLDQKMGNYQEEIAKIGTKKFFEDWDTCVAETMGQLDTANSIFKTVQESGNAFSIDVFGQSAGLADQYLQYSDSYEDKIRKAFGIVPEAFDISAINELAEGLSDNSSFEIPDEWDNASVAALLVEAEFDNKREVFIEDLLGSNLGVSLEEAKEAADVFILKGKARMYMSEDEYKTFAEDLDAAIQQNKVDALTNSILTQEGSAYDLLFTIARNNVHSSDEISGHQYATDENGDPLYAEDGHLITIEEYNNLQNQEISRQFKALTGFSVEEITGISITELNADNLSDWRTTAAQSQLEKKTEQVGLDIQKYSNFETEEELKNLILELSDFEIFTLNPENDKTITEDVWHYIDGTEAQNSEEQACINDIFEETFGVQATQSNLAALGQRLDSYESLELTPNVSGQEALDKQFLQTAKESLYHYRASNDQYSDEWYHSNSVGSMHRWYANEKTLEILPQDYTAENFEFLSNNVDFAGTLGITGGHKEFEDTTFNTLRQAALDTQFLDSQQTYAVLNTELAKQYSATSRYYGYGTDSTMRDIREQLDSLGWKGEKESDNEEINSLLNQARYRTMQLMREDQLAHEEFVKSLPSWLVAIGNGIDRGVNNIVDGIESLLLEAGRLPFSIFGSTEWFDEKIHQNALESQNADIIARAEVGMAEGASDFTMGLFEFTTVATEVGIMIAAGGAIGAAVGGSAGTALTGWKAVASKLILQPKMLPMFTSSLGRNLMEAELDGKSGWAKWGYALPSAYIEGVLEQSMGLFGGGRKLFTEGAKKLSLQTLKNAGIILSENVLWEGLVEENLQDISSMFIKNVAYGNNVLEGDYFNLERMDKTTKISGAVGMFMTLMGAPRHFRSHTYAQRANVHLDSAVKALDAGNMQTAKKEMSGFTQTLKKGAEYFDMEAAQGKFDQILRSKTLVSDQLSGVLQELKGATAEQVEQRQAMEKGKKVDSWYIENVKGRINDGMNKLRKAVGLAEVHLQNLINPWMNQGMVLQTAGNTVGVDNNWNMMQASDTSGTAQPSSFTASVQSGQEANAGTSTNGTQNSADAANTTPQTQNESSVTSSQNKSNNDLFVEYGNVLGGEMVPLTEFTAMREQGGKAWNELTQKVAYKQALDGGRIPPFTQFAEYKNTLDYIANSAPNVVALYGNDVNAAARAVLQRMAETNVSVEDAVAGILEPGGTYGPLIENNNEFKQFTNTFDAEKWGADTFHTWNNELNTSEKDAIFKYTGNDHYENINAVLRGVELNLIGENEKITDDLAKALKRSTIPEAIKLFRGTSLDALGEYKNLTTDELVGMSITEKAFMSTSMIKEEAFNYKDLILNIDVPAGTEGAFIGNLSAIPSEVEVLLNKGQDMIIKKVTKINGQLILDVEIIN